MPALQTIGPYDVSVHGQHRIHVAGVETVVKVLEKFCVAGHRALQYSKLPTTIGLALRETKTFGTGVVALHFMAGAAVT